MNDPTRPTRPNQSAKSADALLAQEQSTADSAGNKNENGWDAELAMSKLSAETGETWAGF